MVAKPAVETAASPLVVGDSLELLPSSVPPPQTNPSVIAYPAYPFPKGYLATWADGRSGDAIHVYAARFDPSWKPLDGEGIRVTETPLDAKGPLTSVGAPFGDGFLVAWTTSGEVRARLLDKDAKPASATIVVATGVGTSGEVAVGEGAIAWRDDRESAPHVLVARIGAKGDVLDPGSILLGAGTTPTRPYPMESCLDCYELGIDFRDPTGARATARVVAEKGKLLSLKISPLPGAFLGHCSYLDAYVDAKGSLGARLGGTTFLYGSSPIAAAPPIDDYWHKILLAWIDASGDVRGVRTTFASRIDDPGFVIRTGSASRTQVVVGALGIDAFVVLYAEQPLGAPEKSRIRASLVRTSGAMGDQCGTDSECESGFCTPSRILSGTGVCCDRRCDGVCEACDDLSLGSSPGKCRVLESGARCATDSTCSAWMCDGIRADGCVPASFTGAPCGRFRSCVGDVVDPGQVCSADGRCIDGPQRSCEPYGCYEGLCFTRCSSDGQCSTRSHCVDGRCEARGLHEYLPAGCGCTLTGGDDSDSLAVLFALTLLAGSRRRRRPLRHY